MHLGELIALGSLSTFPQLHQVLHQLLFPFLIQQNNTNQSALLYFKHPQHSSLTCNRKSSIQMFHQLGLFMQHDRAHQTSQTPQFKTINDRTSTFTSPGESFSSQIQKPDKSLLWLLETVGFCLSAHGHGVGRLRLPSPGTGC